MNRTETIARITDRLPALDDDQLRAVADITGITPAAGSATRPLSPRERQLLAQSKADFAAGRTLTHAELVTELDERLAKRGVPKSTA